MSRNPPLIAGRLEVHTQCLYYGRFAPCSQIQLHPRNPGSKRRRDL